MAFRILVMVGLFIVSGGAAALPDRFDCEVKQIIKLSDTGNMKDATNDSPTASIYKSLIGMSFTVDRETGNLHSDKWFNTSTSEKVTIISDGRKRNAFRVFYVGEPPASMTTFLYVNEIAKDELKPFIMLDSSFAELTFSGTCK